MAILRSDVNRRGVSQSGFLAALLVMTLVWPLAAARPVEPPQAQQPVRIGGSIQPPLKTRDVKPIYPATAQAERRQGVTILEIVVASNGTVEDAKVIRSIGEDFDSAALDAVHQWRFTPTLLNGVAVPVIMTVTVNFVLDSDEYMPPPPPPPTARIAGSEVTDVPPPPPPPPPPSLLITDEGGYQRIGGQIKPPMKIRDVKPIYPFAAQQDRISGVVILELRIDAEGNVTDAKVVRSVALLDDAAREAVMQWKFSPTLLNGVAVPVIMTVTVNFSLQ